MAAEDARAADIQPMLDGIRHASPAIQQLAVRALGRLERESVLPQIEPLLASPSAAVRAEAACALAQAVQGPGNHDVARVWRALTGRVASEPQAAVRAVIYESIGRLPYATPGEVRDAEAALVNATNEGSKDSAQEALLGAARGFEALCRQQAKKGPVSAAAVARFRELVRPPAAAPAGTKVQETAARVRRLSLAGLQSAASVDLETLRIALKDADTMVRTEAASFLEGHGRPMYPDAAVKDLLPALKDVMAAKDRSPLVRYAAGTGYAFFLHDESCAPILDAVNDPAPNVALAAIDGLGRGCPAADKEKTVDMLRRLMATLPADAVPSAASHRVEWHRATHALVAMAAVAPDQASAALPKFAAHPVWQVRVYAARAATALKDAAALRTLAADKTDNVRSAAITGLSRVTAHEDDALFIAALPGPDHQVTQMAARALQGSSRKAEAIPALLAALRSYTAEKKDNTRDARVAILQRLRDFGTKEQQADVTPYLNDFDPRIASLAAEALTAWTGSPQTAAPQRPVTPPPVLADVMKLESSRLRVTMVTGGSFEIRMFPAEAPATVNRVVSLARAGYYNGLTFHRVAPNWVIQGGSPGANEVTGDSPFMIDEVGQRSHLRGALGISTRGHDTGDGQLFVNLNDNVSLDHAFGVWGEVTRGMDVVDGVVEGDVMQKVEVVAAQPRSGATSAGRQ